MRVAYQDCFHLIEPLLAKVEKPSRYIDHEWGTLSKADADYRCCLIYPDVYEVGLPNQGIAILYNILNQAEGISCERGYVPWPDMGDAMREAGIPLLSLEGAAPVASFDIVGLHVPHEMAVTNFLEALDLAGIPLLAADRTEDDPIIIAGGPSVYNPEPYAAFFDAILIGEGEESLLETCQLHRRLRDEGVPRAQIVEQLASIAGNYVPSLYEVRHDEPCSPHGYTVPREGKDAPTVVYKRVVEDFGATNPLSQSCVPYAQLVHDRLSIEILRGCARGCRFCHAGMVYRPVRERRPELLKELARQLVDNTGYNEISLVSLSTADYSCLAPMIHDMIEEFKDEKVSVSLPSLRIDSFSVDLAKEVQAVRKSGLTFAPEAGSQRMRDVINKGVTEEDLMNAVGAAFTAGWSSVKLYFMIGLPGETDEDVLAIAKLAKAVQYKYQEVTGRRGAKVTVSASSFVPKPYTPFQWVQQDDIAELRRKQFLLKDALKVKNITFQYHDSVTSVLEAVFARGDRRLGKALYLAWQRGAKFDGWSEHFSYDRWLEALQDAGLNKEFYIGRERGANELFPWEHIQPAVARSFLRREYEKALAEELTHDCRHGVCTGCGVCQKLGVKIIDWKEQGLV